MFRLNYWVLLYVFFGAFATFLGQNSVSTSFKRSSKVLTFKKSLYALKNERKQDELNGRSQSMARRQQTQQQRPENLLEIGLAHQNLMDMRINHKCGVPRPRVVRVKDIYSSDVSKNYIPSCTVLHKCDAESGCCDNESFQCVANHQEVITHYFYVVETTNQTYNRVELLTFVNDTECECQEINHRPRTSSYNNDQKTKSEKIVKNDQKQTRNSKGLCDHVECPAPFVPHPITSHPPHKCICNCLPNDYSCIRIKNGHERLLPIEVRCVQKRECLEPNCEYPGSFDRLTGSCPRKPHNYNLTRHPNKLRHHQKHYANERD